MRDFWWTKWHWDRISFDYFGFPLSVSFHQAPQPSVSSYFFYQKGKREKPGKLHKSGAMSQ
jgi:hypothetical protein